MYINAYVCKYSIYIFFPYTTTSKTMYPSFDIRLCIFIFLIKNRTLEVQPFLKSFLDHTVLTGVDYEKKKISHRRFKTFSGDVVDLRVTWVHHPEQTPLY